MSVSAKICCFAAGVFVTAAYAHALRISADPLVFESAQTAAFADPSLSPSTESEGGRKVARSDDGMFYANALVNGHKVRFLVDTGASTVVLTRRDARRLGLNQASLNRGAMVRTAAGRRSMTWTTLGRLEIGGKRMHNVRAIVVESGLEVSLLGQNALASLGGLSIQNDELSFR